MRYLKDNNYYINIFTALSFLCVIIPHESSELPVITYFVIALVTLPSNDAPILTTYQWLNSANNLLLFAAFIALLFNSFKSKNSSLFSLIASIILTCFLFTPVFWKPWELFTIITVILFLGLNSMSMIGSLGLRREMASYKSNIN